MRHDRSYFPLHLSVVIYFRLYQIIRCAFLVTLDVWWGISQKWQTVISRLNGAVFSIVDGKQCTELWCEFWMIVLRRGIIITLITCTWIFPQPFPFINFIQRLISFWLINRIVGCMYNDADSGYSFFSWGKQELTQKANDMKLFLEIKISPFIYKIFQ